MKSGLRDRNNVEVGTSVGAIIGVSMKSGLRDRNNPGVGIVYTAQDRMVSMKSGLRDRNNTKCTKETIATSSWSQ